MAKKKYEIFTKVMRRLSAAGILDKVVLIGSWCLPIYRDHYFGVKEAYALRTRDIDLLVGRNTRFKKKVLTGVRGGIKYIS